MTSNHTVTPAVRFLFHTGSIKSLQTSRCAKKTFPSFLFHTGSIKSLSMNSTSRRCSCFYSILVRLKVHTRTRQGRGDYQGFYSILVRLKAYSLGDMNIAGLFLFHTGSIKRSVERQEIGGFRESFYSILVRLKVQMTICRNPRSRVSIPYWFD